MSDNLEYIKEYNAKCDEIWWEYWRQVDRLHELLASAERERQAKLDKAYREWQELEDAEDNR